MTGCFGYLKLYYERNAEMNSEGDLDSAAATGFLGNYLPRLMSSLWLRHIWPLHNFVFAPTSNNFIVVVHSED